MHVAVVSFRRIRSVAWFANLAAMERLLVDAFDATVFDIDGPHNVVQHTAARYFRAARLVTPFGVHPFRLTPPSGRGPRFDVLFIVVNDVSELKVLHGLEGWRGLAATTVLVHHEIWRTDLEPNTTLLHDVVDEVDAVFTSIEQAVAPYDALVRPPVHYLACGVNTPAFRPPVIGERPVDVLNVGRRDARQHQLLLEWAAADDRWYHHDTAPVIGVQSVTEHQRVYGALAARTKVFVANRARFDDAERMRFGVVREIGLRFYEALAAGCALLGEFPDTPQYEQQFGALPGMIPFPIGAEALPDELLRLVKDDRAVRDVARAHRRAALLGHDVAHRLRQILAAVDLPEPEAIGSRIAGLATEAGGL